MTSSLYWRPTLPQPKGHYVETGIKWALQKHFDMTYLNVTVGRESIPYLQGLVDGGMVEAQELIDAIENHDSILLKEES